jgi:hypothetical protein
MKIELTETGLSIHLTLDADVADILRRALLMVVKVIEQRYEVNRKIFMPDESTT